MANLGAFPPVWAMGMILLDDLKENTIVRLRSALATQVMQPVSLTSLRDYLIRLDNEQRSLREY